MDAVNALKISWLQKSQPRYIQFT